MITSIFLWIPKEKGNIFLVLWEKFRAVKVTDVKYQKSEQAGATDGQSQNEQM